MPVHKEKRLLPYTPDQLYELVVDIERYPEFLPWCLGARVRTRQEDLIVADLIIGFRMFRERFTSRVEPDAAANRIDVTYAEGPFKYLENHWVFEDHPEDCPNPTRAEPPEVAGKNGGRRRLSTLDYSHGEWRGVGREAIRTGDGRLGLRSGGGGPCDRATCRIRHQGLSARLARGLGAVELGPCRGRHRPAGASRTRRRCGNAARWQLDDAAPQKLVATGTGRRRRRRLPHHKCSAAGFRLLRRSLALATATTLC